MLVSLKQLLPEAAEDHYAIPCFNVFGLEDAIAVVQAAEQCQKPVILAINKDIVDFAGVETLAAMLRPLAEQSSQAVCLHLDHCYERETVFAAMDAGFSSVMFDGSQLPLADNISRTAEVSQRAQRYQISVEGEIGSVPYSEGRDHIRSELTQVSDAIAFARDSGVDAMAISVGNVHRLQSQSVAIDFPRVKAIAEAVEVPLVIHGTTGIPIEDISKLCQHRVSKFNIGTALRMAFGRALRDTLQQEPALFDRLTIMRACMPAVQAQASTWIHHLRPTSLVKP